MPQTVTLSGDDATPEIDASELDYYEMAVLVRMAPGHSGARPGTPIVKLYSNNGDTMYQFLGGPGDRVWSSGTGGGGRHRVRRLRPGERIVYEG